jgi:hypothetical protein
VNFSASEKKFKPHDPPIYKTLIIKKLLLICYWMGIVADAIATVLLFSPKVANFVLQPQPFEVSSMYLYVSRVAGGLMLGWTVLLVWAQRKPVERVDVLLMTLIPVVTILAIAAVLMARSNQISFARMLPMFAFYAAAFAMYIPAYLWAKKQ